MRKINYIVLHCTATSQKATVESLQGYWKDVLKWKQPGYHFVIKANGEIIHLQPLDLISNGVAGYNANSIHISYIGGIDIKGKPIDNRTAAQKETQVLVLRILKSVFPDAKILGHRDFPGVKKDCPSFDVAAWLKTISLK